MQWDIEKGDDIDRFFMVMVRVTFRKKMGQWCMEKNLENFGE